MNEILGILNLNHQLFEFELYSYNQNIISNTPEIFYELLEKSIQPNKIIQRSFWHCLNLFKIQNSGKTKLNKTKQKKKIKERERRTYLASPVQPTRTGPARHRYSPLSSSSCQWEQLRARTRAAEEATSSLPGKRKTTGGEQRWRAGPRWAGPVGPPGGLHR